MLLFRKLRLLRRIRRYREQQERLKVESVHSSKRSLSLLLKRRLRVYRLAAKIGKIRKAEAKRQQQALYEKKKHSSFSKLKHDLRVYRIAKRMRRNNLRMLKMQESLQSQQTKSDVFQKNANRRKRKYIYRRILKDLISILTLRYSFTSPNNIFNAKQTVSIVMYGVAYFLIAYLLVYMSHEVVKALIGSANGISMKMSYYDTVPIYDPNLWTKQLVDTIYLPGPLSALVIMLFAMIILRYVVTEQGPQRILLLYIIIISATFSVGQAGVSTFMDGGLSYYYQWSWWTNGEKIFMCVICVFILMIIGRMEQTNMLLASTSFVGLLPKKTCQIYFRYQYLIPSLIGILIIYCVKQPSISGFEMMELISIFILLLPSYFSLSDNRNLIVTEDFDFNNRRPYILMIISILLLLLFRFYSNFTFTSIPV